MSEIHFCIIYGDLTGGRIHNATTGAESVCGIGINGRAYFKDDCQGCALRVFHGLCRAVAGFYSRAVTMGDTIKQFCFLDISITNIKVKIHDYRVFEKSG